MATSTPISPFAIPPTPPPPVIVLLSSTDLCAHESTTLLAHQDLNDDTPFKVYREPSIQPSRRPSIQPPRQPSIQPPRQPSPTPNNTFRYHPYRPFDQTRILSPLSSLDLSEDEANPDSEQIRPSSSSRVLTGPSAPPRPVTRKLLIPRPKAAGRKPLGEIVKCGPLLLNNVKKRAQFYVGKYLTKSVCFTEQDKEQIDKVKKHLVAEFPFLGDYDGLWPLDLILITQLKYSSSASKGSAAKTTVTAVRDAVDGAPMTRTPMTRSMTRSRLNLAGRQVSFQE